MSEKRNNYDATGSWQNISHDLVEDPNKAQHMAETEDKWLSHIKELGSIAASQVNEENPLTKYAANETYTVGRYAAQIDGPRAVQATGEAYDALHNPTLPPAIEQPANTPSEHIA